MLPSSFRDRLLKGLVILVGTMVVLRWLNELPQLVVWLLIVAGVVTLAGLAWRRFGGREW